jgi:perosamine synthetase
MIGVGGLRLGRNTERYVAEVLASRRFSYGPFLEKFEQAMANAHDVRFAIMSNSGTSSLQVGLQAMKERDGWGDGDEVIVPAVTFVATANIAIHNRMRPVFVDIEPDYYSLDPEKLEAAITPRTRAIVPVHLFGQPADMGPIMDIAKRRGLRVLEDSCETMFAKYNGKSVGSFGDCAGFSTYVAHLISTGVGGLTLTDDPDLAMRIRSLVNHGRDSIYISIDDDKNKSDEAMKMIIARRFSFVGIGHSFRATEFEGAVGLAQIEERHEMISARRANAARLTAGLADLKDHIRLPKVRPGSDHSFMMYPIVLREGSKAQVTKALEDRGIETRDMLPLVNQPVYRTLYGTREEDYPVAHTINRMGFYVGSHPDVTERDLDHMVEVLHDVLTKATAALPAAAPARAALVLTSYNDAEAAERLLLRIPPGIFDETVAIDAGSTDGTPAILAKAGIKPTSVEQGRRANQFEEGLRLTTAEYVVFLSLDGSEDPADTERLLFHLKKGLDMVVASRYLPGARRSDHGKVLSPRGWGNRMLALAFNLKYGTNLSDPHNGLRGIRRGAFNVVRLQAPGFTAGWALSLLAGEKQLRVDEIPTWEGPRRVPRSLFSLVTNGMSALGMLLKSSAPTKS